MWGFRPGPTRPYRPWGPGFQRHHPSFFQSPNYPMQNRPGGFLARLFGRRQPQRVINPFQFGSMRAPIESQSTLPRFLSPENLSKVLGQTQQVLRTVQQVGPMIQQYGPLIRNLPTLWKLYKGFSSTESEEVESDREDNLEKESDIENEGSDKKFENDIDREEELELEIDEEEKLEKREEINHSASENIGPKKQASGKYRKRQKKKNVTKESVPKLFI